MAAADTVRRLARSSSVRLGVRLVALALVVLLALRLWQLWRRHPVDFSKLDGGVFVLAVVVSALAVTAYGLVWPYILRRLGVRATASWITLFFTSQLAKYLPGSVWQYAGRVGLAHGRGVPVQTGLVSVVDEVVLSAAAAAIVGALVLPTAAALAVLVAVAVLIVATYLFVRRRDDLARRAATTARVDVATLSAALRSAPSVGLLYLPVWGLYGLAFWLTGRALFDVPVSQLGVYVGVFALAWLAGLAAIFAPGGIGVREAVMVALLADRLGEAHAIVLAGTSRLVLAAVDLVAGGVSLALPLFKRRDTRPAGARR